VKVTEGQGYTVTSWSDDWLKAIAAAEDETLVTVGSGIAREAKQRLVTQVSRATTGQLARSIGTNKPHTEGGTRVIDVGITTAAGGDGAVAPFHYALAVEFGRKAGKRMPPSNALLRFVRLVIKPRPTPTKGKSRRSTKDRTQALIKSVAFLVARAIGKKGIKARPYMRPSFERIWPMMMGVYREKLAARLKNIG
jgi:hypothetical protein